MSYDVKVMEGPVYGYMSQIVFFQTDPTFITYIDIACTGIGSIALVWGIISVFNTGRKKKLAYMISAAIIIYILNLIRNVFIAIAFVEQWFAHPILQKLALASGANGDKLVSFVVAETFISQFLSAILLFIGLFIVVTYTNLLENIFSDFEDDVDFTYSYIKNRLN
jgi:archaeosortase A (PGF-CTERM-specific)